MLHNIVSREVLCVIVRSMGNPKGVKRDFKALAKRRVRALRLLSQGLTQAEVGRKVSVPRQTVHRWATEALAKGEAAVKSVGRPGRKPKLSEEQREKVREALKAGPEAEGYATALWTTERVARLIEKVTGVRYHADHVGRLLSQLGWSCQRPEGKARERDEARIRRWKRVEWPRLKKKPAKRSARSSS